MKNLFIKTTKSKRMLYMLLLTIPLLFVSISVYALPENWVSIFPDCIYCGSCWENFPDEFSKDGEFDEIAQAKNPMDTSEKRDHVEEAIAACPVHCIQRNW